MDRASRLLWAKPIKEEISMVKVIMGVKGSGKTKLLVDMVNAAALEEKGNVVCLEHARKLDYDINYSVRLVDVAPFNISGYTLLKGFICGLYAGNFDISNIFIDSLFKITKTESIPECEEFLDWLKAFCDQNHIKFIVVISADINTASEGIRKYF